MRRGSGVVSPSAARSDSLLCMTSVRQPEEPGRKARKGAKSQAPPRSPLLTGPRLPVGGATVSRLLVRAEQPCRMSPKFGYGPTRCVRCRMSCAK
jgi:hypothetical protein